MARYPFTFRKFFPTAAVGSCSYPRYPWTFLGILLYAKAIFFRILRHGTSEPPLALPFSRMPEDKAADSFRAMLCERNRVKLSDTRAKGSLLEARPRLGTGATIEVALCLVEPFSGWRWLVDPFKSPQTHPHANSKYFFVKTRVSRCEGVNLNPKLVSQRVPSRTWPTFRDGCYDRGSPLFG